MRPQARIGEGGNCSNRNPKQTGRALHRQASACGSGARAAFEDRGQALPRFTSWEMPGRQGGLNVL